MTNFNCNECILLWLSVSWPSLVVSPLACSELGAFSWWPLLGLLSWCSISYYPGAPSLSQVTATHLKTWQMKIYRYLTFELQRLDYMTGYQDSSPRNGHQGRHATFFQSSLYWIIYNWRDMNLVYLFLAATKQLYEWFSPSIRPSVRPSVCHTFLTMFPSWYHHEIFRSYYQWQKWCPCKSSRSEVKGQGHRGHNPT